MLTNMVSNTRGDKCSDKMSYRKKPSHLWASFGVWVLIILFKHFSNPPTTPVVLPSIKPTAHIRRQCSSPWWISPTTILPLFTTLCLYCSYWHALWVHLQSHHFRNQKDKRNERIFKSNHFHFLPALPTFVTFYQPGHSIGIYFKAQSSIPFSFLSALFISLWLAGDWGSLHHHQGIVDNILHPSQWPETIAQHHDCHIPIAVSIPRPASWGKPHWWHYHNSSWPDRHCAASWTLPCY